MTRQPSICPARPTRGHGKLTPKVALNEPGKENILGGTQSPETDQESRQDHQGTAAFMFTAGQDYPVIAVAQILSRGSSAAAWDIYVRRANDSRELPLAFGASR